jgi:hypothetical protein
MRNTKCFDISVVTGTIETVTKGLKKYLEAIQESIRQIPHKKIKNTENITHITERTTILKSE